MLVDFIAKIRYPPVLFNPFEIHALLYASWQKYLEILFWIFAEMNEMVNEMVSAVDDGDGEIDYDEFVSMIQKY